VEIAASGSAPGLGVADDHGNLATTVDGTIYAAIKTGYNTSGTTRIGLLVRRTSGTWDPLYPVVVAGTNSDGSRPMLLLNEADEILTVVYTSAESGPHIRYKESPLAPISFPAKFHNLTFGSASFNNSTSTKQNVGNEPTIIYASSVGGSLYSWAGVKLSRTPLDTDDGAGYSFNFTDAAFPENKAISISTINLTLNIQGNTSITIEAWVNINSLKNQSILNKIAQSGQTAYELGLTSSGKIYFKINTDSLASASNYALDEWIHIAAVYNLSDMRLYINGKLDNWMVRTGTIPSNTRAVLIGAKRVGSTTPEVFNQGFDGSMDEVRVWAAVRTETQIQNNMCKKLQGTQTELRGYWRFDEPYGLTVPDYSGNDNYGSIFNLKDFRYTWSGAPIGDFTAVDFDPSGGFSQSISHSDGDTITATITGGTEAVTGLLLYRVDSPALRDSIAGLPPDTSPYEGNDPFRFWGVKVFGTGSYTMDVTYDFSGHPGIIDESLLDLVHRDNPSENGWDELFTIVDEDLNTLSITMVKDGEFSLASSGVNPLPVELSLFTARINGTKILLNWRTETEVRNYGFDIERSSDGIEFYKIDFIEGHGNSNSPKLYSYIDPADGFTGKVYYRLKQIDTDGTFSYSKIISVDLGAPVTYELFQNYPNPFNPATTIRYQIPEKTFVTLKVYNSIGEQVAVLVNEEKEPGYYELNFNAQNLASGLYIYNISASGFNTSKKMLLLK